MPEKYKNKYRTKSIRLQHWNYGWNAAYFVTICTHHRHFYLGTVRHGVMGLSPIGCLAWQFWHDMPKHFPFVNLGAFVVMPNHVHGIVVINKLDDGRDNDGLHDRGAIYDVSTAATTNTKSQTKIPGGITGNKNPMLHDNLSRIIRWYKGCMSFHAHQINCEFRWQPRFYEHIIRNEMSYDNISNYIVDNPRRWHQDKFNDNVD